jgi:hypothetical protein
MSITSAFVYSHRRKPLVLEERAPMGMDGPRIVTTIYPGPNVLPAEVVERWRKADRTLKFRKIPLIPATFALD